MEHTLLIDTDPGVDDALALLMALRAPNARVVGLTIAAGNVGLQHTVANALKLLDVVDQDVPVYPGCAQPLVLPALDAAYVHGRDGFGDTGYTPSSRQASEEHAAIALLRLSHDYAGELTLVMVGPLTNLALALRLDPSLPKRIKRLVIMGAAVNARGNMHAQCGVQHRLRSRGGTRGFQRVAVFRTGGLGGDAGLIRFRVQCLIAGCSRVITCRSSMTPSHCRPASSFKAYSARIFTVPTPSLGRRCLIRMQ